MFLPPSIQLLLHAAHTSRKYLATAASLAIVFVAVEARAQEPFEPAPPISAAPPPPRGPDESPTPPPPAPEPSTTQGVPPAPREPPGAAATAPLSGFHNGLFYLRDRADIFRLYVMGRVHADAITYVGPGIASLGPDSALKTTLQLRRLRPEIAGEFFNDWQWDISVDVAPTANDNPAAKTASRSCSVDPSTGSNTCSDAENAVEAPLQRPAATDAFVNWGPWSWTNVQIGQYLIPFTMENRVSDNTTPFLERTIVSRGLGAPFTRDIGAMVWGQDPESRVYYTVGIYNGDGANRTNADNRFDVVGRAFARPFVAQAHSPIQYAQIGLSGRYGSRDPKLVGYDAPSLTTQGGYVFWKATYKDSLNRTTHIIPSGDQGAVGAEVHVPFDRFSVTSELVYAASNTREAVDEYQLSPFTERLTRIKGFAWYVIGDAWLFGSRDIIGPISYGKPLHADLESPSKPSRRGLQALVKLEQLHLTYSGARAGNLDPKTPIGDIDMLSVAFGLNFWATRHLRVGLNYTYYDFPSSEPTSVTAPGGPIQTSKQRAVAPAQSLVKGAGDDAARDGGHTLNELQMRVGVQF